MRHLLAADLTEEGMLVERRKVLYHLSCRSESAGRRAVPPMGSLGVHLDCRHDLCPLCLQHLQLCL